MAMKPSGKFVLRIQPELHHRLRDEAMKKSLSLNNLCLQLLSSGLNQNKSESEFPFSDHLVDQLQSHFSQKLVGILLFGSRISGGFTQGSDLDILIVLDKKQTTINRGLYRWWDQNVNIVSEIEVNPQFVYLPSIEEASGLWFEVATSSKILWQSKRKVTTFLGKLKEVIASDQIRRYWSNGQAYWVRSHAK